MMIIFYTLLGLTLLSIGSFVYVLLHERRSMWAGTTLVSSIILLNMWILDSLIVVDTNYPNSHSIIQWLVVLMMLLVVFLTLAFILTLIVMFFYNGVKILFREGARLTNFLSLGMGVVVLAVIFAYPWLGRFNTTPWFRFLYLFLSLVIFYLIAIMMMYTLTSWLNLLNWHPKKLDYVVVLGAGLRGKEVAPLLASRIKRGIEIYHQNPGSKLIMSGGQGPDEEIPESHAMAHYAESCGVPASEIIIEDQSKTTRENIKFSHRLMKANSRFCIVTNSYHVYRALVLAKRQGLACIGYGAKTKWYFTLNAFVREFIAYLVITKKMQCGIIASFGVLTALMAGLYYLGL
ncbi:MULTISPECIES: YdcF family protein [Lactobacillus]|uniref:DUF218 domain-containing protein n=1 Tax=Lactobacillus xujianguonis TaxID=2495899 RepID=A0A437SU61_9LACO|nr:MULTISPECIES: YdcF family protein [Lactobacillus]RVU70424.1 hypothetical protein EJK17_07705 [Lactobacillus xujianguonis]RVU73668.1 hypothetical protein EJK20_07030 [Lactobacillus xujianguonis]